jgi:hypothetical protein
MRRRPTVRRHHRGHRHTVVTRRRLTREPLYVSMTRGRAGNHAYVSENDPSDEEPLILPCGLVAPDLVSVLAAEGANARPTKSASRAVEADSLERQC